MALNIQGITRVFEFGKKDDKQTLSDPNPNFSPEEVMSFYCAQYPELTTASVSGPEIEGNKAVYEFKTNYGTKG